MSNEARFGLCRNVEHVLDIGRDFQKQDRLHGAHYDTVKLLCDTIEYLRDQLPKPDSDWEAVCERCRDGDLEPDCEYYGEPNGCNSPIYGEHPKTMPAGNAAAMREALETVRKYVKKTTPDKVMLGVIEVWCDEALAKPPRNCDVGTSDEQAERFENFCLKHIGCAEETGGRHCVGCPLEKSSRNITQKCELYWAQMPYEEGGAS